MFLWLLRVLVWRGGLAFSLCSVGVQWSRLASTEVNYQSTDHKGVGGLASPSRNDYFRVGQSKRRCSCYSAYSETPDGRTCCVTARSLIRLVCRAVRPGCRPGLRDGRLFCLLCPSLQTSPWQIPLTPTATATAGFKLG